MFPPPKTEYKNPKRKKKRSKSFSKTRFLWMQHMLLYFLSRQPNYIVASCLLKLLLTMCGTYTKSIDIHNAPISLVATGDTIFNSLAWKISDGSQQLYCMRGGWVKTLSSFMSCLCCGCWSLKRGFQGSAPWCIRLCAAAAMDRRLSVVESTTSSSSSRLGTSSSRSSGLLVRYLLQVMQPWNECVNGWEWMTTNAYRRWHKALEKAYSLTKWLQHFFLAKNGNKAIVLYYIWLWPDCKNNEYVNRSMYEYQPAKLRFTV